MTVFIVDSVGEHRGLHYHNFPLASELSHLGVRVILLSTPETCNHELLPDNIETREVFKGIYGPYPKAIRGLCYSYGLLLIGLWSLKERPQIVHFHFFQIPALDLLLILFLRLLNIVSITSIHDIVPLDKKLEQNSLSMKLFNLIYKYSISLNVHSNYVCNLILELEPSLKNKMFLTRLGNYKNFNETMNERFKFSQADAKNSVGLSNFDQVLLIFGTIKPNKRLDWVINAMKLVVEKNDHVRLLIVGSLQDRDVQKELLLVKELGLDNHVLWRLEKVSDEELSVYLIAADIVLFPYEWIYQSAGIIMAMSFGKPIIANDVGSIGELIKSGNTGLLVQMDNPEKLASAIKFLLINQKESHRLGDAALRYVDDNLSWHSIAQITLDNYQRLLEQNVN